MRGAAGVCQCARGLCWAGRRARGAGGAGGLGDWRGGRRARSTRRSVPATRRPSAAGSANRPRRGGGAARGATARCMVRTGSARRRGGGPPPSSAIVTAASMLPPATSKRRSHVSSSSPVTACIISSCCALNSRDMAVRWAAGSQAGGGRRRCLRLQRPRRGARARREVALSSQAAFSRAHEVASSRRGDLDAQARRMRGRGRSGRHTQGPPRE